MGRNVADTVHTAIAQAMEAAGHDDSVLFVDSGSTDASAAVARRLGVPVLDAPVGKGAAVAALLTHHGGGSLCLLDADIEWSGVNFAAALRDAWREADAEMLVGSFDWPARRELRVTLAIHGPLLDVLFPEAGDIFGRMPLSGFRVLNADWDLGPLPPGYGLEAHFNTQMVATGGRTKAVELGVYEGPVVPRRPDFAYEIGAAILDVAQAHGRLASDLRPAWEAWLARVAETLGAVAPDATDVSEYQEALRAAMSRPLPPARRSGMRSTRPGATPSVVEPR